LTHQAGGSLTLSAASKKDAFDITGNAAELQEAPEIVRINFLAGCQ
jgi:hypothetical protein